MTVLKTMRASLALLGLTALLSSCSGSNPLIDGGCTSGTVGCSCAAGNTCTTGECVSGTCTDCRRGDEACSCRSNGTCNASLSCTSGVCTACVAGKSGCPCAAGSSCEVGLTCSNGTCTSSACTAGAQSCPCRTTAPACDGDAYCDTAAVCRACSADVAGCACGAGNACSGGLTCDSVLLKCRQPTTCLDLLNAGTCKTHQQCNEAPGVDAVCVASTCTPEWKWDARTSTCVACASPGCAAEPTCAAGSFGDTCTGQNRECVPNGMVPYCGPCKQGFVDNGGTCIPSATCGTMTCSATQYCDRVTMTCLTSPCPPGQAKASSGACMSCGTKTCTAPGETGHIWPFMNLGGQCICETVPGWFQPGGGTGAPFMCDEDGDGWVNEDAASSVDPQVLANARCDIESVDTVLLTDELGAALPLKSCDVEGLVPLDAGACTLLPLRLLETQRNDRPSQLAVDPIHAPLYGSSGGALDGGTGRALEAREINSLTKACVQEIADFNDNGTADVAEVSPMGTGAPRAKDRDRLEQLAYFVELYTSYYVPGAPYGSLVIRELSRCADDFPLHYQSGAEPYDGGASTYWRSCSRNRDPSFNAARPGYDLAKFDCAGAGTCPYVPPPAPSLVAPLDPGVGLFRDFGTCETAAVGSGQAFDGRWRGMMHHSQFKCVSVKTNPSGNGYDVDAGSVGSGGDLVMNECVARPCNTLAGACRSKPSTGPQTERPAIDCHPVVPATSGRFGMAAVRYRPYGNFANGYLSSSYQGGCVNEEVEMPALPPMLPTYDTYVCPWPEYLNVFHSFDGGLKARSDQSYGRYSCFGDLPNFLWGPAPDGGVERATLRWAPDVGGTTFGVLR
ncbi:MAG: hypothetical protein JNK82_05930 [Myxococcaceae bacterium]|nr:hypothetical protein [Myxococcaceae bacterium]